MELLKLWSAQLSIEHCQGTRTKERWTVDVVKLKHTVTAEEREREREREAYTPCLQFLHEFGEIPIVC